MDVIVGFVVLIFFLLERASWELWVSGDNPIQKGYYFWKVDWIILIMRVWISDFNPCQDAYVSDILPVPQY